MISFRSIISRQGRGFESLAEFEASLSDEIKKIFKCFRAFVDLDDDYVLGHINRTGKMLYSAEYRFKRPQTTKQTDWFYRTNEKYIFSLLTHKPWQLIEKIMPGKILDYGAGIGIDVVRLAEKPGYQVDFFDINILQSAFMEFFVKFYSYNNIRVLPSVSDKRFDPINSITDEYDGILLRSVLEHVVYYEELLQHLLVKLKPGGYLYEASKFGKSSKDPMHIEERISVSDILSKNNCILIYEEGVHHVWQKV